ncbi:MAG: hypothetical protein K8T91_12570 [Planctomycetes bacterium]|nr:hypothetical protein [Planctomycetota bacterium]
MTIEFRCIRCLSLLCADDTAAGTNIRCANCSAAQTVPHPSQVAPLPRPPAESAPQRAAVRPPIVLQKFDAAEALLRAWRIYMDNLGQCLLAAFTVFLGILVPAVILGLGCAMLIISVEQGTRDSFWPKVVIMVATGLCIVTIGCWLLAGMTLFCLRMARGEPAHANDVFSGGRWLFSFAVVHLVVRFITLLGLLLLIVPGVLAMMLFFPAPYLVIDRGMSARKALIESIRLTWANWWNLFLVILISIGITSVAGMIPAGELLVLPLDMLLLSIAYLMMTGQPTGGEPPSNIVDATIAPKPTSRRPPSRRNINRDF